MITDPKAAALWMNGDSVSPLQLEIEVGQLIEQLACCEEQGVIGLASDNAKLIYLFVHACLRINQPLFILNPELPAIRLQKLLNQSRCTFVVAEEALKLSSGVTVVEAETFISGQQDSEIEKNKKSNKTNKSWTQLIVATSGSSGIPKAVMLSISAIAASARAVNDALGLHENDCWLNCLPLYHIAGLSIINRCHYAGASMVLHEHFNAEKIWKDLSRYRVTHISLVPAMLSLLLDVSHDARPPSSLHIALIGGASLSISLARRAHNAGWPIVISYGMTETGSLCAFDDSTNAGMVAGRVGRALDGFEISAANDGGNISVRGPALMSGYANPDLEAGFGLLDGGFVTGDVGRLDEQGVLYLAGRCDDVLISAGTTIHPREVEEQLEEYAGIGRVAISALPDGVWGDKLVAVFEPGDFDAACFESWAREQLASVIRPRIFVQLEKLPVNHMGKLDRTKLREIIQQLDI